MLVDEHELLIRPLVGQGELEPHDLVRAGFSSIHSLSTAPAMDMLTILPTRSSLRTPAPTSRISPTTFPPSTWSSSPMNNRKSTCHCDRGVCPTSSVLANTCSGPGRGVGREKEASCDAVLEPMIPIALCAFAVMM